MKPSEALRIYYALSLMIGLALVVPVAQLMQSQEIGIRGGAIMALSLNVIFMMILPLVLDWSERRYFKARFVKLEEVASEDPEFARLLNEQCNKLCLSNLRLAVVESKSADIFSYGLWGINPRLIVPGTLLKTSQKADAIPSIEAELNRFASRDQKKVLIIFGLFTLIEIGLQHLIISTL